MFAHKVQPNKTILAPDGSRFIVRGVQMFDYMFVSFEARTNYDFRSVYNTDGKGEPFGISEPTYYGRIQYKSEQHVYDEIKAARDVGANLIRVGIEPPIRYASVEYIDPNDGLVYPSDMDMLDTIIQTAESLGLVVQLQNSNDSVPTACNVTFLTWLADRYKNSWNVWINPANEMNGTNAQVNNPTEWQAEMRQYVSAIRSAGFTNPICIDPPGWGSRIDLIYTILTTDSVFANDNNLIIQPHFYALAGQADFRNSGLPTITDQWFRFVSSFCVVVGETGIDNFAGRYDPLLDPGFPSVSMTAWGQMQAAISDFLTWANEQVYFSSFNGVIGHNWGAYIPGLSIHDDNSMRRQDGTWTTWGTIFKSRFLSPPILSSAQYLGFLAGLTSRIGNGTIGTPAFQIEGKSGERAAGAIISPNGYSPMVGFFRRDVGDMIGLISGNGSGVTYGTTSDYRLKENPAAISQEEIFAFFSQINPVLATWIETGVREPVFIAHEIQALLPSAVTGEKDGKEFQTVDYSKSVPMLAAAVKFLLAQMVK